MIDGGTPAPATARPVRRARRPADRRGPGDLRETVVSRTVARLAVALRTVAPRTLTLLAVALLTSPAARAAAQDPDPRDFLPLVPERLEATGGAALRHVGGGVVLAEGANPDTVTYELDYRCELGAMSAFRLDVLPDPSLPRGGSGRAPNGNFVLSELELLVSRGRIGSRAEKVELREAVGDHEQIEPQGRYPAAMAIDGVIDNRNGWAADAHRFVEPRALIVVPKAPVGYPAGCLLTLRLVFATEHRQHSIGSFRFSATEYPDPVRLFPPRRGPPDEDITRATERGIAWLLDRQLPDGSWPGPDTIRYYGMTALAGYTLLQCGLAKDHPAIRAAIAYVDHHPMERTYDIGCTLMAYKALGDESRIGRVEELAGLLIDTVGNGHGSSGQWGYPFGWDPGSTANHLDLSNSQYALLGLRAAASFGVKVPLAAWERAGKDLIDLQDDYGSFRYQPGREPSASMTVAGIACAIIIAEQLPERRALRTRLEGAAVRGEQWLRSNWSVETNLLVPRRTGGESERWYYYYMYGLERVGSLANKKMLGGHDWHAEGARALLAKQNDDGSWSSAYGEKDANTCFALMYLIRGTRSTGLAERPRADVGLDAAAFVLQSNQENPLGAWVGSLGAAVEKRLDAGERPTSVDWLINGAVVDRVLPSGDNPRLERFPIRAPLQWNGAHEVVAAMRFQGADGADTGVERSAPLTIRVDSVEEPRHREAIFDNAHGVLDPRMVEADATSAQDGHGPALAADGRFGTCWVSADGDERPILDLKLRRPVRAAALKLTAAHPWLGAESHWARPKEIEIQLNGGRAWQVSLIDDVRNKQRVSFAPTTVRRVRIRVLSVYRGTEQANACGFKEVELIDESPPDDGGVRAWYDRDTLIAPGAEAATSWRYTFDTPDPAWTQRDFDDAGWAQGAAPFGSGGAATAWPGGKPDLWIRRVFELREPPRGRLVIELASDDIAEVYVNGVPAAINVEYSRGTHRHTAVLAAVTESLEPGLNVVAAHCKNTGGAAQLDVGVRVVQDATR